MTRTGYAIYTAENDELVIEYVCKLVDDLDDTYGAVEDIRVHTVVICGIEQDTSMFDSATLRAMERLADELEFV